MQREAGQLQSVARVVLRPLVRLGWRIELRGLEHIPVLSRAAVAAGIAGLFMETHPDPAKALSDGPNAWPLGRMEQLLSTLKAIDDNVKQQPFEESLL